jgi:hypothetical protein
MPSDDDVLRNRVIDRLHAIRARFGSRDFRAAARRALVGIAKAALAEGERRAAPSKVEITPENGVRSAETVENRPVQQE